MSLNYQLLKEKGPAPVLSSYFQPFTTLQTKNSAKRKTEVDPITTENTD